MTKMKIINGIERIYSYVSGAGLTIYGREYYHAPSKTWYIVGDCSENKDFIKAQIELNNLRLLA